MESKACTGTRMADLVGTPPLAAQEALYTPPRIFGKPHIYLKAQNWHLKTPNGPLLVAPLKGLIVALERRKEAGFRN
jgi:hypothetical protein